MFKRIFHILKRDIKVNTRDFLTMYMISVPLIFAALIVILSPGINDTTVNLALVEGENVEMEEYLRDFAKVSLFENEDAVIERIEGRDDVFGYLKEGNEYIVVRQGNESENITEFARYLLTFYTEGVTIDDTTATITSFDRTVPPLKKLLIVGAIMFTIIMGGMLISINIIEEKTDKTVRAIHLTPTSDNAFIIGKGLTGVLLTAYGTIALVVIGGFGSVDWGQVIVIVAVSSIISLLVGFMMGISSESFMDAAGSVKMLFLPLMAAILVVELLDVSWHWTMYWNPFYWTYVALDDVLSYTSTWNFTLMASGIILAISIVIYVVLMPRIRKGLS